MKLFCAAALALSMAAASWAAAPPAEVFFADPAFSGATLSPDGRKVAMVLRPKGQRARLAVLDLDSMKPTVVAAFEDQDVRRARWVNDQRLVFDMQVELTGPGVAEIGHGLYGVNADGSGYRQLVQAEGTRFVQQAGARELPHWSTFIVDVPGLAEGDSITVARPEARSRERVGYYSLQRLNTVSGRVSDIETPLHSSGWAFDMQGRLRAAVTSDKGRQTVQRLQPDGSWKLLTEFDALTGAGLFPRWVGPDGKVYAQAGQGGRSALFVLDEADRPTGAPIAASPDFDLQPEFVFDDRKLLGLRYTIDAEVTQWLDADAKALQARIDELLPATSNRLSLPRHGDSPWVLVQAFADVQPTLTLVYQRKTGKLSRLGVSQPGIEPKQMGQTDFVRYKARDGLTIPAWLTLPPGGGKKLPLVVLVHGGPYVRGHAWRWDAEVQFLASRGYAVLQPEFRGSTGYGQSHFEAGFRQWGRAMQDDIADGARWAIAQGHADAGRICIAGASYGGYATLMGLLKDPALFRCGVSWVGVTDIGLLFSVGWSDITYEVKKYGMSRVVGDPVADAELFKTVSPLENAARIRQPLLLAYGAWDVRVPLVHGEKFRDAIRPHNDAVEWVVYPNEGHGWARPENRVDFWNRVERFLARHIGTP